MIRRVLLSVVSVLVLCMALEIALRTTHMFNARVSWTEPDRQIGWRFTPGREYWFFGENDHAITGRINSMGWRDRERVRDRARGTRRIAVLGDSYVEAFQVELDSTFVAIAERWLNTEVMNFGRSGMSPAEELLVLQRDVLPWEPDIVLLLFTPQNDIADVNPATAVDACRPFFRLATDGTLAIDSSFTQRRDFRIREVINPFKQRSALLSLVIERFNAARLTRAIKQKQSASGLPRELTLATTERPDSVFFENYKLCKYLIGFMADMCIKQGARLVLASVPVAYDPADVKKAREADPTFDPEYFEKDLAAFASSQNIAFVELGSEFRDAAARGESLQWTHWSYAGHALAGRLIAARLATIDTRPWSRM